MRGYWTDGSLLNSLDGKTVEGIDVSQDERALRFRCSDGETVVWDTNGDCCSESWWADACALQELRAATVSRVESLEMPDDPNDGRTRQECDTLYGYELYTDKGSAQLVFRNSSNGYYGGWATVTPDDRYEWREIEGNAWSA